MLRRLLFSLLITATAHHVDAATLRVPRDHQTIQAAIDAAAADDVILVAAGKYPQRLRLKPHVIIRSEGDDTQGTAGLRRAEATIIDGGVEGQQPGVVMAEGSTLDGFTITNVGRYDDALWKKHFDSQGEALGDDEGSVQAEGTVPAIAIQGVRCVVLHNIVHHNGDVGIGILGQERSTTESLITDNIVFRNMGGGIGVAEEAKAIIRGNVCRENLRAGIGCRGASPILVDNECYENVRAGIGCREGAKPIVRGNQCYRNRRAGIGIRMEGTTPVVEGNACYENAMAGIGCRDGASPLLRNNVCTQNKLAGIGCNGASPLIVGNECQDNERAGIGLQGQATATIHQNRCLGNKLVAIGVTDRATATITDNRLSRSRGMAPIIAVKDGSTATILRNHITGGGVAAILVQGTATIKANTLAGAGAQQGNAIWVWEASIATISDNTFTGYRTAVAAKNSTLLVSGNTIGDFQKTAIVITDSPQPAHVYGNTAISADPQAKVVQVQGPVGVVEQNVLKTK